MAGIQVLDPEDESLDTLRDAWSFACARVASDPHAAPFLSAFIAFGPQWDTVKQKENALRDGITKAEATAVSADHVLNGLLERVSAAIHRGKRVDTSLPQHRLYFGNEAPSIVKRPTLGAQLERMRSWPALLAKETEPELNGLHAAVSAGVTAGNEAEAALEQAEVANNQFRLGGERTQLFDAWNSLAATAYGGLKAFAHDHPELRLSAEYAESFFRHASKAKGPKTVQEAAVRVEKLEKELEKARRLHADLLAEQAAAVDAQQLRERAKKAEADAKKTTKEARAEAGKKIDKAKAEAKALKAEAKAAAKTKKKK